MLHRIHNLLVRPLLVLHYRDHHDGLRLLYLDWVQYLTAVLVLDIVIDAIEAEIKLVQLTGLMALQAVGR